jgi:hypothetical protein
MRSELDRLLACLLPPLLRGEKSPADRIRFRDVMSWWSPEQGGRTEWR